ncbi:uncharacterized protein [Henckelia pumila]|uniref:uncharacterized protein n=1 Tax=Henckelia pumila TaxID=405737 RepID=UPI003C6DE196
MDEECEEVLICPPIGSVKVARTIEASLKEQLIKFLNENKDIFAWAISDLLGVRTEIMEHKMNVIREYCHVIQKKRHFGPEKYDVIQEQVEELLKVGHIQEVYFPTWLSNLVLVPKSSGKCRMCVGRPEGLLPLAQNRSTGGFYIWERVVMFPRRLSRVSPNSPSQGRPVKVQGEELFVYLDVTPRAASSVLVRKEGINHLPVYFVSYDLKGAELNYMTQENLALALVITARKLRPYCLYHPIIVLTNSTLGKIAANPDASGRLIKWITELSEYDINFEPRTAIKAQALADFLAETVQLEQEDHWKIFVDGSSCQTESGVEIVIVSPWGEETNISIRLDFRASKNEAEYEALLLGLKAAQNLGVSRATLYSDSQLSIQQSKGKFETRNEKMIKYARALDKVNEDFTELTLELIPRTENTKADHLARFASSIGEPFEPGLKEKSWYLNLKV